jgi:hypothetical protein
MRRADGFRLPLTLSDAYGENSSAQENILLVGARKRIRRVANSGQDLFGNPRLCSTAGSGLVGTKQLTVFDPDARRSVNI